MNAKLIFLGDFEPVQSISSINMKYNIENFDLCFLNLEAPIRSRTAQARPKAGPHLSGSAKLFSSIINSKYVINLANNHIMDFGEDGLIDTLHICEQSNIVSIGAGKNLIESQKAKIIDVNGIKIGIIGCAENQFGASSCHRGGYAPITSGKTEEVIYKLSRDVDICIVSIHGGSEMSPWPSPRWQERLRGYIDLGATIIHGHHSHVPQGFEEYNEGLIYYGLGNFLVDPSEWYGSQNTLWSLTPEIIVSKEGIEQYNIKTSIIEKENNSLIVRRSTKDESLHHETYFMKVNLPLKNQELLTAIWQEVSTRFYHQKYGEWLGFPTKLLSTTNILKTMQSIFIHICLKNKFLKQQGDQALLWYHLFACETHRDSIETALGIMSGECEDLRDEKTCQIVDEMMPWSKSWVK